MSDEEEYVIINGKKVPKSEEAKRKGYYFDNYKVEQLLTKYVKDACIDVKLRDEIMSHAGELINNIIRTNNFQNIYPGRDSSSFGDLFQVAWVQIESMIYKFDYSPGHTKVFNLWCVSPETYVFTNDGMQKLGDIVGRNNMGSCDFEVYGIDGLNRTTNYVRMYDVETMKLGLKYGYKLEATPTHPIQVLTRDGIRWKRVAQLKVGDLVAVQFGQDTFGNNDEIHFKLGGLGWNPPNRWNEDLAYIIGLIISEGGGIYQRGHSICSSTPEIINSIINNKSGLNYYVKHKCVLECLSSKFNKFLNWLGYYNGIRCDDKFIPDQLLRCSKNIVIAMLRGMFDGDGGSSRYNGLVTYTSTSKELIDQLRILLLNFGIVTKTHVDNRKTSTFNNNGKSYKSKNKKICYQLSMSTKNSLKFYNRIGFTVPYKQDKEKFLSKKSFRLLPSFAYEKVHLLKEETGIKFSRSSGLNPNKYARRMSIDTASKYLEYCKSHGDNANYRYIQERVHESDNIEWLEVQNIEESKSDVVDIEVPVTNSFTGNGIIQSNSQVAKTAILAYIKKETRDKKNFGSYKTHLTAKPDKELNIDFERFLDEARDVCKYNDDFLTIIESLEELYKIDDKPHDGLIGKLVRMSGLSRSKISSFLKHVRLRSFDFTDSPINVRYKQQMGVKQKVNNDQEDD